MADGLVGLCRTYADLRKKVDRLEDELSAAKQTRDEIEKEIFTLMIDTETDMIRVDGVNYRPKVSLLASIPGEMSDAAFEALRVNGFGSLIKETVNAQTLSAWAREYVDENGAMPPWAEGIIRTFNKQKIEARKS